MRRTYVPLVVVVSAALVALLVYGVVGAGGGSTLEDAVLAGERPAAPTRELPGLDGGTGSLADFRGKPVIVNFWASWCEPCEDEAPLLERAHARLQEQGGTVLGVTVNDATDASKGFVQEFGISFPNLRDVDDELGDDYDRGGVPETFAIDREGRVVGVRRGPVTREWVDEAVALVLRG